MNLYKLIFLIIPYYFIFFLCKKNKILIDSKSFDHKKLINQNKDSFLLGGIFLIFFFMFQNNSFELIDICFFLILFLIGLGSDLNFLQNPKFRFFFQLVALILFVIFGQIKILDVRVDVINIILQNNLVNMFFCVFCLMILVNGMNFIDGINNNAILYSILISIALITINFIYNLNLKLDVILNFLIILIFLFFLNYYGTIFLGDSGSYLIGIFIGVFLIEFSNLNNQVSPYFIVLLVSYPCFEILFSILRRTFLKKKSYEPDHMHLHQILYKLLNEKINFNTLNKQLFTSLIINSVIFIFFVLGILFYKDSKYLIMLICLKVCSYIIFYILLRSKILFSK